MSEQRFALIVASTDYEDASFRQLVAPAQDAEALAHVLADPAIGGFEVLTLLNEPHHKVNQAIDTFFSDRKRDDLVLLYFSCHGIKDEERDGRLYFVTRDTQRKLLRTSAVQATFVIDAMQQCRSQRQVLLLDCCYGGAFARGMVSKGGTNLDSGNLFKGRGRGRIVLTASDAMSYAFEGDEITGTGRRSVFTSAIVNGLTTGEADADGDKQVTLDELFRYIEKRVEDETPHQRPEMWSYGVQGDIVIAQIPNRAAVPSAAQDVRGAFIPIDGETQCYVIVSETEGKSHTGGTLKSVVRRTLIKYRERIERAAGQPLQVEPYTVSIARVMSSKDDYEKAIIALCRSSIAILDVTNYEPAIMLLLGIRSVVRRGITIASAGGDYVIGDPFDYPFSIKEVNIVSHSPKQLEKIDPIDLIGRRIVQGFVQLRYKSGYLDLPSFDAIRTLPPDPSGWKAKTYDEQVLALCSFRKSYQDNNWKKHLLRNLAVYLPHGIDDARDPEIVRTLDMKSPRLVSQSLYEAIRFTSMCIVDWTDWRPNVFFELGVRVAANKIGPICIIEDIDRRLIEDIHRDGEAVLNVRQARWESEQEYYRITRSASQCKSLLQLFNPIDYRIPPNQEDDDDRPYRNMVAQYESRISDDNDDFGSFTYRLISNWIDCNVEISAKPVHEELIDSADMMSNSEIDSEGRSPVLYPDNVALTQMAEDGALERRLAAWYYLDNRYTWEEISGDRELTNRYQYLGDIIAPALMRSPRPTDKAAARDIRKRIKEFKERVRGVSADAGHS